MHVTFKKIFFCSVQFNTDTAWLLVIAFVCVSCFWVLDYWKHCGVACGADHIESSKVGESETYDWCKTCAQNIHCWPSSK